MWIGRHWANQVYWDKLSIFLNVTDRTQPKISQCETFIITNSAHMFKHDPL